MLPDIIDVNYIGQYRLRLCFDDGTEGEVDIAKLTEFRGVFAALADLDYFALVRVDTEVGTVVWPDGQDLDPLILYRAATGREISLRVG